MTIQIDPPWLELARHEVGVREVPGKGVNPKIVAYFRDARIPGQWTDEDAWCAAFVGAMLARSGQTPTGKATARSYLNWGQRLEKPVPGCIAVFWRVNPKSWQGHVGFYIREDATSIYVLSGNQYDPKSKKSEVVNISRQDRGKLLGYFWPIGVPCPYRPPLPVIDKVPDPVVVTKAPEPPKPDETWEEVEQRLREEKSEVFTGAERLETVTKIGVGGLSFYGMLQTLFGRLSEFLPTLVTLQSLFGSVWDYAWIFLLIMVLALLWEIRKVKNGRVEGEFDKKAEAQQKQEQPA